MRNKQGALESLFREWDQRDDLRGLPGNGESSSPPRMRRLRSGYCCDGLRAEAGVQGKKIPGGVNLQGWHSSERARALAIASVNVFASECADARCVRYEVERS